MHINQVWKLDLSLVLEAPQGTTTSERGKILKTPCPPRITTNKLNLLYFIQKNKLTRAQMFQYLARKNVYYQHFYLKSIEGKDFHTNIPLK